MRARWRTGLLAVVALVAAASAAAVQARAERVPDALADQVAAYDLSLPDGEPAGRLELTTDRPATVTMVLDGGDRVLAVTETAGPATEHVFPLLELRAETRYRIGLEIRDGEQLLASGRLSDVQTGSLPAHIPPIEVAVSEPERMSSGLTLFNSIHRAAPGAENPRRVGHLTAVDEHGEVVWWHHETLPIQDARRLDDGDLLFISDETGARRISPTGQIVGEWRGTSPGTDPSATGEGLDGEVTEVDIHSMHHEILELDDGSFLTLSRVAQERTYDEPLCDDSTTDADGRATELLVGDSIAIFDPATGEVLAEHSLFDAIDPRDDRIVEGDYCLAGYMDRHYPEGAKPRDWTHANAVVPADDGTTFLVSARHTDQILALRAQDEPEGPAGSLRWALGPDDDIELTGDGRWFWHQHAPEPQPDGTILLYDNGNGRTDAPSPYSRAVRYAVDPSAGTATQVWQDRTDPDVYAMFVGDADRLDGTVLTTHGGLFETCRRDDVEDDTSYLVGRIVEVDEASGETVFDLRTRDPEGCVGWGIYRSERILTLYPPDYEVERR